MPNLTKLTCSLRPEFRAFMNSRNIWPGLKAFRRYFEINDLKYNKFWVSGMKRGECVPENYAIALVDLMAEKPAIRNFIAARTAIDPAMMSAEQIIEIIAEQNVGKALPHPEVRDWFMCGIDGISRLITDYFACTLVPAGTQCKSESDVKKAVRMIFSTYGREVAAGRNVSNGEAIGLAEKATLISMADYVSLAIDSWRFAPWSVAFAVFNRRRVACWRILPVTQATYENVRAGNLSIDRCTPHEMRMPSPTLYIDGLGQVIPEGTVTMQQITRHQLRTMFLQFAQLSYGATVKEPLRVLTMAGTPDNEGRAKRLGFIPTGTQMCEMDIPLFEMDVAKSAVFIPIVVAEIQRRLTAVDDTGD